MLGFNRAFPEAVLSWRWDSGLYGELLAVTGGKERLVKLADKTCNLRDVATSPPADWPLQRRREYFDWACAVVDALPVVNRRMLKAFRAAFAARP